MLEMAKYVEKAEADQLISDARRMIKALYDHCAVQDPKLSNGQLLNSTYCRSTPTNGCLQHGVDECFSWGDYFYFEALTRLSKDWEMYW